MNIFLAFFLLFFSFMLIGLITQRYFIPSLERIADWMNLSENVAGASLLAFGSSAPELFTALLTLLILHSEPSFGVGSIIGSALFQILVVIGFAAAVKTSYLQWRPVLRDGAVYLLAVGVLYLFVRDGVFTLPEGAVMVGCYLLYLALLWVWSRKARPRERRQPSEPKSEEADEALSGPLSRMAILIRPVEWLLKPIPHPEEHPRWTLPVFILSLVVIGAGTWIFVEAGIDVAHFFEIDPAIIALTVIAGGSSAPELFSSAIVARRGKGDMAIANALGSNTFDIFISLGLPVFLTTLIRGDIEQVGGANIVSSTILLLATLVMVIALLAVQKFKASRPFGLLLILSYVLYVAAAYLGWFNGG